jgi:pteridine reductase
MQNNSESPLRKVALVTGGARRIGAHIARRLHAEGLNIALHFRRSGAQARHLRDELNAVRPASVQLFEADLLNPGATGQLIRSVLDAFRRMDVLVNNASIFYATPLESLDDASYEELLATNLKVPLFLAQAAAAELGKSRGCIVNIADIYGIKPLAGYAAYCAAKAGLIMLTRALAVELAPHTRVNAVAPGAILWPESASGSVEREAVIAQTPMRRAGDPADVAEAVLFLVRDAPYVTGQVIKVDGGRAIG